MSDTDPNYLPIMIAAAILVIDVIAAAVVFLSLRRQEHAFTFLIPLIVLIAGVLSAILVYFLLLD